MTNGRNLWLCKSTLQSICFFRFIDCMSYSECYVFPWDNRDGSRISSLGSHLKKLCRAEGGSKMFGVFRVKNHDFTPKNLIFSNFRGWGARTRLDPPLWSTLDLTCFWLLHCYLLSCNHDNNLSINRHSSLWSTIRFNIHLCIWGDFHNGMLVI